jgi:hypothetical protein
MCGGKEHEVALEEAAAEVEGSALLTLAAAAADPVQG